jgi:hypothetical protein
MKRISLKQSASQWSVQTLITSSQLLCQAYGQAIASSSDDAPTDWDTDTLINHSQQIAKGYTLGL